jgi:hypothetical protein
MQKVGVKPLLLSLKSLVIIISKFERNQWKEIILHLISRFFLHINCNLIAYVKSCKKSCENKKSNKMWCKVQDKMQGDIPRNYLGTLANSILITLFSEMLKCWNFISSKSKNIVKENSGYLRIFHLLKWMFQNLLNYSMDMCWNGQGTIL